MSKKSFKAQASSSKAFTHGSNAFGSPFSGSSFGNASSALSYLAEQPDLSSISDSNIIVQFKNLAKRDSTTKARALEEIQNMATLQKENGTEVEDNLLIAWIKVYPRMSIDISRRVRQLAHQVHGQICLQSGRKIAKHMPSIIGAWFAGLHDGDRIVFRAASEAFDLVFPTPDKRAALPKVYHSSILEFCRDAILTESPQSLSDERMTNKDDSEAKYSRLISSSILSLCSLIENLSIEEANKQSELYEEILGSEKLWSFFGSTDSAGRRAIFKLLKTGLKKHSALLSQHIDQICKTMFSDKILKKQTATALDYVAAVRELLLFDPNIFTVADKKNQTRTQKFFEFVKKGSQGASEAFWKTVKEVLRQLPDQALPTSSEQSEDALNALKIGINQKDEIRSNAESAWECYIELLGRLGELVPTEERQKLMDDCAIPILEQYLDPAADRTSWTIQGPKAGQTVINLLHVNHFSTAIESKWSELAPCLLELVKTSTLEEGKDFKSSQDSIVVKARKWFDLQRYILQKNFPQSLKLAAQESSITLAVGCIESIQEGNGKPYGAVEALKVAISNVKLWLLEDDQFREKIEDFLSKSFPKLINSPSRASLVALLYECRDMARFTEAWNATLRAILECEDEIEKRSLLALFLTSPQIPKSFNEPLKSEQLQNFLRAEVYRAINGSESWDFFRDILRSHIHTNIMTDDTFAFVLTELINSLTIPTTASNSLAGLEVLTSQQKRPDYVPDSTINSQLRQNVLLLTESDDDSLATRAATLNERLTALTLNESRTDNANKSDIQIIQTGLSKVSPSSLSVETLVELALQQLRTDEEKGTSTFTSILPNLNAWEEFLQPLLNQPMPQAFFSSIELGSAICTVESTTPMEDDTLSIYFDKQGLSAPLRMCLYTISLLEEMDLTSKLSSEQFATIFQLLLLTVQLMNDKLTISSSNKLWSAEDALVEESMLDNVSRAGKLFSVWLSKGENDSAPGFKSEATVQHMLPQMLWSSMTENSWPSFHHARAYCFVVSQSLEISGWKLQTETLLETRLKELRKSNQYLLIMSFVSAFKPVLASTKYYLRVCNELVADLTGIALSSSSSANVMNMTALLSLMLDGQDHVAEAIAKQRIVFFIQHVVPWLKSEDASELMQAQICLVLKHVLPLVYDVYGSFWSTILEYLCFSWNQAEPAGTDIGFGPRLPLYNASLRLFSILNSQSLDEDTNDDLKDAIKEVEQTSFDGMLHLLKQLNRVPDSSNQPLQTVNELLGRQIAKMPTSKVDNVEELVSLIAAESLHAQRCAFELLHKYIPKQQEQISVDTALEKRSARLPDELLSLVIEGPAIETLSDSDFLRTMPLPIRSYLSAWLLIFDSFKGASDKVRNDYTDHLKESNVLPTLLEFIADFLGHSRGKPIDASKFDATVYSFDIEESPLKDVQWLLTHVYFLSLKRLPALTKSWWMDCKSRQTVLSIESWTEKYISSHVVADALETVSKWAKTQDSSSDDAIIVKCSQGAKEITVSKEIDDQMMSMVIRLPNNYPLGEAVLTGINRVAVDEKKWRSWLMNSQGVIRFSNNSLIDGIVAFRRNVVGALKGQTECAICYAIVGADKQLPTKKCGTCNNLFHGSCLYRWFKSSNASTCPLCRNPFNYA